MPNDERMCHQQAGNLRRPCDIAQLRGNVRRVSDLRCAEGVKSAFETGECSTSREFGLLGSASCSQPVNPVTTGVFAPDVSNVRCARHCTAHHLPINPLVLSRDLCLVSASGPMSHFPARPRDLCLTAPTHLTRSFRRSEHALDQRGAAHVDRVARD